MLWKAKGERPVGDGWSAATFNWFYAHPGLVPEITTVTDGSQEVSTLSFILGADWKAPLRHKRSLMELESKHVGLSNEEKGQKKKNNEIYST